MSISQEEIEKALKTLEGSTEDRGAGLEAELSELDQQIISLQAKREELSKGIVSDLTDEEEKKPLPIDTKEIVKAVSDELSSKFESFANISKSVLEDNTLLKSQNDELKTTVQDLLKSQQESKETLEKAFKVIEQIGNSPMSKLGAFKSISGVERFAKSDDRESLSLTQDKRKVLSLLEKSLETEEGSKRVGNIIGFIENGYIDETNFSFIKKSVENELGDKLNITI